MLSIQHMFTVTVLMLSVTVIRCELNYTWPRYNDKYDSVVGISVNGTPVCTGHLISARQVITSSNAIAMHGAGMDSHKNNKTNPLKVHFIKGAYNKSKAIMPTYINHQCDRFTKGYKNSAAYKQQGQFFQGDFDIPTNDIAVLMIDGMEIFTETYILQKMVSTVSRRESTMIIITTKIRRFFALYRSREYQTKGIVMVRHFDDNGHFTMAGHGFIDRPHVKRNLDLDVVQYKVKEVRQNCDEWFPRWFGHFICLLNIDSFVGINSGAPLYYNDRFVGIGAFSLSQGNESILVFTDLRRYENVLHTGRTYGVYPIEDDVKRNPDSFTEDSYDYPL